MEALGRNEVANRIADFLEFTTLIWATTNYFEQHRLSNSRLDIPNRVVLTPGAFTEASAAINSLLATFNPPLFIKATCDKHIGTQYVGLRSFQAFDPLDPNQTTWDTTCGIPSQNREILASHILGTQAVILGLRNNHRLE